MSKLISNTKTSNGDLQISSYCGKEGKRMLQITQGLGGFDSSGYIQLDTKDTYFVVVELTKWIQSEANKKSAEITEQIKEHKELQKSIFSDAVACSKYIEDMDLLEIPLRLLDLI